MKRKLFGLMLLLFIMAMTHVSAQGGDELTIVDDGQAQAVIVIPENPDPIVNYSANRLEEYVRLSSGAVLPIMTEQELLNDEALETHTKIYVGHYVSEDAAHIEGQLEDLDIYGFVIYANEDRVSIIGPHVRGTRNGAFDFLERYVGVRWLMDGPDGTDIPEMSDIVIPYDDIREEPAFPYRVISSGLSGLWPQANRQQGDIKFMHNLHALFPPEKFGESNPEFYPGGIVPAPGDQRWGQPCLNEDTVQAAVDGIIEYFNENPDEMSYALGVNDTSNYCETNPNHPLYPGKVNSTGYQDMSDIYYAWVNDIVEQVLEVHPDKWFGLLAYNNVTDPPSFPIHERVVPFLTKDRMSWIDEEIKDVGHQIMDEWNEVAAQVAWYDYMYGTMYVLPRVYPHLMSEIFQYAADNNVYGHYIEMYFNAGDGPKAWLATRLMWDPYQDVDVLLQEWYERTVGPAAAADLAALYDLWEHFWTERIKESTWFEMGKSKTYLPFNDQSYVHLVTNEDIAQSMQLIENVVAKAETPKQKARAEKIQRMFEYYEASALSYPRHIDPIHDEASALTLLDEIANTLNDRMEFAKQRLIMKESFENDEALRFRSSRWYDWTGWNSSEFWNLANYIRTNEADGGPVTERVNELAISSEASDFSDFIYLLKHITADTIPSLTTNSSFEEGNQNASSWTFWNPSGSAHIERIEGVSRTGDASILLEGAQTGGVYQIFDVESALTAAEVHYYTPNGTETNGGVRLVISMQNANGQTLGDYISPTIPLADTVGEWASIGLFEVIPEQINNQKITRVLVNAQVHGAPDAQVYFDDVTLYQQKKIELKSLTLNSSFEDGDEVAISWSRWNGPNTRVEGIAHSGNYSILRDKIQRGGPHQTFPVEPGLTIAKFHYYTPVGTPGGSVQLSLHLENEQGERVHSYITPLRYVTGTSGRWHFIELIVDIPEEIDGQAVKTAQAIAIVDHALNSQVYIDDFTVYQHPSTSGQLKAYIEELAESSAIVDQQAVRALTMHLTAVELFEKQGATNKVTEHLSSLHLLLDHYRQAGSISADVYEVLSAHTDALLKQR